MKITRSLVAIVVCVILVVIVFALVAQEVLGVPAGTTRFLSMLAGGNDVATTATDFVDMPDMTASISVPGRVPTCITATFSGMFQAGQAGVTANGSVSLRALLDDILMEGHNAFDVIGEAIPAGFNIFRSYTFWKCDVAPGAHTVRIQWHTHVGAPALASRARTLVVEGR